MSHYSDQELENSRRLDAIYKSARLARRKEWLADSKRIEEAHKPSKFTQAYIDLSNRVKVSGASLRNTYEASSLALIIKSIFRSF